MRDTAPETIINAADYNSVDGAETETGLAMQVHASAPGILAKEAKRHGALLLHYSTDYVLDGTSDHPYSEDDAPNPLNFYGKTKLAGERLIALGGCAHLILRASCIYSARGSNFVLAMLKLALERKELWIVDDQIGSPSWARTLAPGTAELLGKIPGDRDVSGIYHFSAPASVSRFDFAARIIAEARSISGENAG